MQQPYNLIVVLGPTATGKTRFAAQLADRISSEVISADSRQVYRSMDLGTGKDYDDYIVDGKQIPFHLIDIHEPGYKYNVYEYQQDFVRVFRDLTQAGKTPVLCGGTGMYIEAVTAGYKLIAVPVNEALRERLLPKSMEELTKILSRYKRLHNKTDTDTKKRAIRAIEIEEYYAANPDTGQEYPSVSPIYLGLKCEREIRRARITRRLHERLKEGMIEEVRELMRSGVSAGDLEYYGLEYKFITRYLKGDLTYDEMVGGLNTAIHQFAKRQMTWFRKMEREGKPIHWIDSELPGPEKLEIALDILNISSE